MANATYADTIKDEDMLALFIKHGTASPMNNAGRVIYAWDGWCCNHYPAKGIIWFYCPKGYAATVKKAYESLMQI